MAVQVGILYLGLQVCSKLMESGKHRDEPMRSGVSWQRIFPILAAAQSQAGPESKEVIMDPRTHGASLLSM